MQKSPYTICFFPWLSLKETISLGAVSFVPFKCGEPCADEKLHDLEDELPIILSSYKDIQHRERTECLVACIESCTPPWNIGENHHALLKTSVHLLTLSALADNEYFTAFGHYSNSSIFQPIYQKFTKPVGNIAFAIDRRDGQLKNGGYEHGEVTLSEPLECHLVRNISADKEFASALFKAHEENKPISRRIISALSFFNLSFTDWSQMLPEAEVVLTASAFEQLYSSDGAYNLSCSFGETFKDHGRVTVEDARKKRNNIRLKRGYEAQQKKWWLHKKWIEELHNLRSHFVHGEDIKSRSWGWASWEHLVMAAFAFPLAVKLLLASEGYYNLTPNDEIKCVALDNLLIATDWDHVERSKDHRSNWTKIIGEARDDDKLKEAAIQRALAKTSH